MSLAISPTFSNRKTLAVASTDTEQVLRWSNSTPVTINPELKLAKFNLYKWRAITCENFHYTGNFSCLRLVLTFRRELEYHFAQEYIPTMILARLSSISLFDSMPTFAQVVASWISFWLDVDAVPARITLAVTTMLTTFAQHKSIKDALPPVSYTKVCERKT